MRLPTKIARLPPQAQAMLFAGLVWCAAFAFEKESLRAPETQILPAARTAATLLSEPTLPILTDRLASVWAARQVYPATGYALLSAADGLPWQPATPQAVPASPWLRAPVDRDGLAASVAPGRVLLGGNWTSSATVHADGAITFGGRVPAPAPGQLLLAPFLGDLYIDPAAGGRVWTLADAASALVTYENLQLEGDPGTSLSAQAAFHADGRVAFRYGPLAGATNLAGRLFAGSALGTNRWDWLADGTNGVPGTLREGLELTLLPADEGVWMSLDTDGDGLPDFLETFCGTDPASAEDPDADPDGDGLPTFAEAAHGTDPHRADTDSDGLSDLLEIQSGRDPLVPGGEGDTESAAFRLTLRLVPPAGSGAPGGRAVLAVGPLAVPFSADRPIVEGWFRLPRGRAHGLRLVGDLRGGTVEATLHYPYEGMVLYDPDGIFGPGLPPGTPAPFASAFLAFPTVALDPATPCVHTPRSRTVAATVQPPGLPGSYRFTLPDGTATPAESADGTASISVDFPASETRVLTVEFLPAARPATTVVPPVRLLADVAQCPEPLPDEGGADDWDDFLGWPDDEPETDPPTPAQVHHARTFLPMNSDDDDANGAPDHGQAGSIANEDDLLPVLPRPAHTDCCACPEHSATVPGKRLASLSSGLRLWTSRQRTQAFAVGTYASVGQVLYLEGAGASAALGDQVMDWVEVEGGADGDHHVTGHTVMRLQIQPDLDGDADVDADDLVLRPGVSGDHGVLYGAASNRFHRIDLRTDGSVAGTYELRLDGPEGAFRIWGNATGTGTPLLSLLPGGNSTATVAPIPRRSLWLECLGPGAGTLRYRWRDADGEPRFGDALAFTVLKMDIVQSNEFAFVEDLTNVFANLSSDRWTNVTWRIEPHLGTSGALFSAGATNIGTANLMAGTNVWISPGDIATNYTIAVYANELTNCLDTMQLRVLDVYPKAETVYVLAGHTNDIVHLEVRPSNSDYVWSLVTGAPSVGTFSAPSNSLCQFLATTAGNNSFRLRCGGVEVWTKSLEVIPITPRSVWGADAPDMSKLEGMPTINRITVHHSSNTATGTDEVQRIQDYHMSNWPYWLTGNNWGDIGYHYLQAQNAEILEGRQLEGLSLAGGPYTKGSHVAMNNTAAGIGFCLMADYESVGGTSFTAARQLALEKALTALCRRHNLTATEISYHQAMDLSSPPTACPGKNVISQMSDVVSNVVENLK